ncbi:MAG: DUF5119 domain-containing protein [Alistipes sp.]|nr:DUF5119 domain-containing protein [Alistipes sp.]
MSRIHNILLVAVVALLSVACQRRPMEEEYLRVYLDLHIDKNITNYEVGEKEPGLMRVMFFDAVTKEYLSHDFVSQNGGYIFAPYGDVDMVVYNIEAGNTYVHNQYSWLEIEAYTDEISEQQRSRFTRYLQSRVDTRPSYDDIRLTPGHLFVAREQNIHIPRHISQDVFLIQTTAKTTVESWTVEINGVTGMEWVGSVSMMISGQVGTHYIATNTDSTYPIALYFDKTSAQRRSSTIHSRFETFGRERTSGDIALLSILFTDIQGHPYMYNFDVSEQMENNPLQHIVINGDINIPKPEIGGGFAPEVDDWREHNYDIDI